MGRYSALSRVKIKIMFRWLFRLLPWIVVLWSLLGTSSALRQNSSAPPSLPSSTPAAPEPQASSPQKATAPDLSPPRSDRVNAADLSKDIGESSSKDTQVDLTPPDNDAKAHPKSAEAVSDAEAAASGGSGVGEFRPWDPHKAAKDVEVGDFYFKRKNYRAAEDRYREALYYKDDDAIATYQLAICLEKLERPDDALAEYQSYLRILPHGPQAEESKKAIERLSGTAVSAKKTK